MKKILSWFFVLSFGAAMNCFAWDYAGHRMVNQVALASLPKNFPAFVLTPAAQERIAFLAGEPDRWRNMQDDLPLKHFNGPDHFIDLEDFALYGINPRTATHFRYEFVEQLAVERAEHPKNFPPVNPDKDETKTGGLIGFLPWTINEYYGKLKSSFAYLKALEEDGTPEEISNAQQNVIDIMGLMGHFVGDSAQPLHTTKHFNGWVGATNPNHYATNKTFHGWIDGRYIDRAHIVIDDLRPRVRPARVLSATSPNAKEADIFPTVMSFILEQHKLVEPLYVLNRAGDLSDHGEPGSKGRAFITKQLLTGGQFLGDLWVSAWQSAPMDTYLKSQLAKRKREESERAAEK